MECVMCSGLCVLKEGVASDKGWMPHLLDREGARKHLPYLEFDNTRFSIYGGLLQGFDGGPTLDLKLATNTAVTDQTNAQGGVRLSDVEA